MTRRVPSVCGMRLPDRSETAPSSINRPGRSPTIFRWGPSRVAFMTCMVWFLAVTVSSVRFWEGPTRIIPV